MTNLAEAAYPFGVPVKRRIAEAFLFKERYCGFQWPKNLIYLKAMEQRTMCFSGFARIPGFYTRERDTYSSFKSGGPWY